MSFPNLLSWRSATARDDTQLERHLRASLESGDDSLDRIAAYFTSVPASRHRARAAVAASLIAKPTDGGVLQDDVVDVSIAVELAHIGTSYHDDVIHKTQTRNQAPTANKAWGDLEAILAGDFLIARASELASTHGTEIAKDLATTIGWMCEGRQRELGAIGRVTPVDERLETLSLSVGSLFSTATRIAGILAGVPATNISRLAKVGGHLGLAFAIGSDIDRFVAGEPSTGLSPLYDLERGHFTLPVLLSKSPPDAASLDHDAATVEHKRLCAEGVVQRANNLLNASMQSAIDELVNFDNDAARQLSAVLGTTTTDSASNRVMKFGV